MSVRTELHQFNYCYVRFKPKNRGNYAPFCTYCGSTSHARESCPDLPERLKRHQ